jgi:thiamine pyrophosphate-dependent acetolactate synthase large subunit-like protein
VAYLDLPSTLLKQNVDVNQIVNVLPVPPPPLIYPDMQLIENAADTIASAERPLIIIGKGYNCFSKHLYFDNFVNFK